jgi:hypothetical protein
MPTEASHTNRLLRVIFLDSEKRKWKMQVLKSLHSTHVVNFDALIVAWATIKL